MGWTSCEMCGRLFFKLRGQKYCTPECRKKAASIQNAICREMKQKARERVELHDRPSVSFSDVFAYIERVKQETGEYLTYGKAVARMNAERERHERVSGKRRKSTPSA